MLFAMRVSLPDQPGVLGSLALALGRCGANIVSLEVVERDDEVAVDDLIVEMAGGGLDALHHAARAVPSAMVEALRPLDRGPQSSAMELAAALAETDPTCAVDVLVRGIPEAMWASWCVALEGGDPPTVISQSVSAPSIRNVGTPWLPLFAPRRFHPSFWMPPAWRMGKLSYEVAAVPLGRPDDALLVVRKYGPRFRKSELRDLSFLVRIALARSTVVVSA